MCWSRDSYRAAEEFGFDHVGCISDPTREAADCGAAIIFHEDSPPDIDESNALLADKSRLAKLNMPDPLGRRADARQDKGGGLFKEKTGKDKIIEGWIEGPCAEGADLRGINTIMTDFFEDAGFVRDLFEFTTAAWVEVCEGTDRGRRGFDGNRRCRGIFSGAEDIRGIRVAL